jgi:hypothetical protein
MSIWYILKSFGIVFSVLVCCNPKNLATLFPSIPVHRYVRNQRNDTFSQNSLKASSGSAKKGSSNQVFKKWHRLDATKRKCKNFLPEFFRPPLWVRLTNCLFCSLQLVFLSSESSDLLFAANWNYGRRANKLFFAVITGINPTLISCAGSRQKVFICS